MNDDLVKMTYQGAERIEVDGKTSSIPVKRVFNPNKGTGVITLQISTKQISPKQVYKDGVLELVSQILSDQYDKLLEEMTKFAQDNPVGDPAQGKLHEEYPAEGQRA